MSLARMVAALLLLLALSGCWGEEERAELPPPPSEVTEDAIGHYCGMQVAAHDGPKGQIHLASRQEPVWFTSVRDTVAFTRLPEEPDDIVAIYVNDMGKAREWNQPEAGTWMDARQAWYVIESDRRGGMGAPEAVPFSAKDAAEAFRGQYGGRLVRLEDIPDSYVLGPVELLFDTDEDSDKHPHSGH